MTYVRYLQQAEWLLGRHRAAFRTREASRLIERYRLYSLAKDGIFAPLGRGAWSDTDGTCDMQHMARDVFRTAPLCLLSALHQHRLLDEEPKQLWLAIDHRARRPKYDLEVRFARMSGRALTLDLEPYRNPYGEFVTFGLEKTLADCLKFRSVVGAATAYAAVHRAAKEGRLDRARLRVAAEVCRVTRLLRPWL